MVKQMRTLSHSSQFWSIDSKLDKFFIVVSVLPQLHPTDVTANHYIYGCKEGCGNSVSYEVSSFDLNATGTGFCGGPLHSMSQCFSGLFTQRQSVLSAQLLHIYTIVPAKILLV